MTKVFIFHGSYGNPDENWFPWLKKELEKDGLSVFVPKFSTPKNQNLKNWIFEFQDGGYFGLVDEDSVLIGHSLGPSFILSILEMLDERLLPKPVKACFFVSGFLGLLGNSKFDELNKTFTIKSFNFDKILKNCEKFYLIHSDNDPYVPLEKAKELAEKLHSELIIVKNAGHFNESSGFKEFDLLLELIKKELKI